MDEIKTFCCWIFSYNKFLLTGRIQRSAFVPGETINISGEIANSSGIKIHFVNISLKKVYLKLLEYKMELLYIQLTFLGSKIY